MTSRPSVTLKVSEVSISYEQHRLRYKRCAQLLSVFTPRIPSIGQDQLSVRENQSGSRAPVAAASLLKPAGGIARGMYSLTIKDHKRVSCIQRDGRSLCEEIRVGSPGWYNANWKPQHTQKRRTARTPEIQFMTGNR